MALGLPLFNRKELKMYKLQLLMELFLLIGGGIGLIALISYSLIKSIILLTDKQKGF